jgi:hypothetical protein
MTRNCLGATLQAYYNVVHPQDLGPEWQIRFALTFLFPE